MKKEIKINVYEDYLKIIDAPQLVSGDKNIVSIKFYFYYFFQRIDLKNIIATLNIIDNFGSIISISNEIIDNNVEFIIPNELLKGERQLKIQLKLKFEELEEIIFIKDIISFRINKNLLENVPGQTKPPEQIYEIMLEQATKKIENLYIQLTEKLQEYTEENKIEIKKYIETFFTYSTNEDIEEIIKKYI